MKKKILLVQSNYHPPDQTDQSKIKNIVGVHPPMGLLYIASVLLEQGFSVDIYDANFLRSTPEDTAKAAEKYDIVGISIMSQGHSFAEKFVSLLPPNILKVCGGPHPSGFAEELLDAGFNVVVRGEGEWTMGEICQGRSFPEIKGISYRNNGHILHNPSRPPFDPNKLPLPARHLIYKNGTELPYASAGTVRFPWAPLLTSRGCPYTCYYCSKKVFGKRFTPRSPENVVMEIEELVNKYKVRELDILDDIFNFDPDRAVRICQLIAENGWDISLRFPNGLKPDRMTKDLAYWLKRAGCTYAAFGIESGNDEILKSIPKRTNKEAMRQGILLTKEAGIEVAGLFILGLLDDTEATMQDSIDFAKELGLDIAYFSIATPYPGTRMYDIIQERGGEILFDRWDILNSSYGKVLYRSPDAPAPELVEKMFRKSYREFYLRPGYIARQALKHRTWEEYRVLYRGFEEMMRNLIFRR